MLKALNCAKNYVKEVSPDCWATCFYIMFLPATVIVTPAGSLLKIITYPVILVLIYKLFFGKNKPLRFNLVHITYTMYVLYTVGLLWVLYTDVSMTTTKDMVLALFTVLLVSVRVYNSIEKDLMEKTWLVVGVISLCFAFFSSIELAGEGRTSVRIFGFYEDPNQFCAYFIVPVMISIKRILEKSKFRIVFGIFLILIFYAILRTGSRGGLIAVIAGIASYVLIGIPSWKKKLSIILVGILLIVFILAVVFPLLPEDVQERYQVETVEEDKGSGRFEIWSYLINYTFEKPERLIHGMGIFSTADTMENSGLGLSARWAHNQFVQVLADQGVIGLGLFLIFAMICFFRNIKTHPELACAFVAVMALSFSLSLYVFKPYINIIMMCAMSFEDDGKTYFK